MAAAAQADDCASSKTEGAAFRVHDFKIALYADGSVVVYRDASRSHSILQKKRERAKLSARLKGTQCSARTQGSGAAFVRHFPEISSRHSELVFRYRRIYFVGPRQDASLEIEDFAEARLA
jgi:hypothetical protein